MIGALALGNIVWGGGGDVSTNLKSTKGKIELLYLLVALDRVSICEYLRRGVEVLTLIEMNLRRRYCVNVDTITSWPVSES